jgi:hypothetical protein
MHRVFRINATQRPRSARMARGRGVQDSSTITPLHACVQVVTATPIARSYLQRAALAGGAKGLRSTVGTAALLNAGAPGLPETLTRRHPKAAARLAVAVELVFDKLPSTPSRLARRGLTARIVYASIAGALVARGANQPELPAVLVACTAAVVSAGVGHDVRAAASERFQPLLGAAAEDGIALSLAAASTSLRWPLVGPLPRASGQPRETPRL